MISFKTVLWVIVDVEHITNRRFWVLYPTDSSASKLWIRSIRARTWQSQLKLDQWEKYYQIKNNNNSQISHQSKNCKTVQNKLLWTRLSKSRQELGNFFYELCLKNIPNIYHVFSHDTIKFTRIKPNIVATITPDSLTDYICKLQNSKFYSKTICRN